MIKLATPRDNEEEQRQQDTIHFVRERARSFACVCVIVSKVFICICEDWRSSASIFANEWALSHSRTRQESLNGGSAVCAFVFVYRIKKSID